MSRLINHLKRFNRKERFILLSHVLGPQAEEVFRLNPYFAGKLAAKLGVDIPNDAFVAMDYHLDWIQAAMCFRDEDDCAEQVKPMSRSAPIIEGTQEDIDLLVAFDCGKKTHIVLIEAKGDTPWDNDQIKSKASRFSRIFDANVCVNVTPHFVMMSPSGPQRVEADNWPCWMKKMNHIQLALPKGLLKVTRYDGCGEEGKKSYGSFRVERVS